MSIQFPLAHPAVTGLIAGVRTQAHLDEYPEFMRRTIPTAVWDELRRHGLIPDAARPPRSTRATQTDRTRERSEA